MSPTDQSADSQLTRKQLRELRLTGATPIVVPTQDDQSAVPQSDADAPVVAEAADVTPPQVILPRAADPLPDPPRPPSDEDVDVDAIPRTRRQAREQERIRTASVPVIDASGTPVGSAGPAHEPSAQDAGESPVVEPAEASAPSDADEKPEATADADLAADPGDAPAFAPIGTAAATTAAGSQKAVLQPTFGETVIETGGTPAPSSFDDLLTRGAGTSGTSSASNALILAQTPGSVPLTAPVTATGEVLVTGTFALPEGLGSQGHAPGTTDGKDVDAVLIDGELPASSSPTPIAASAAVSQVKTPGEIIRPPAPEKSNKAMVILAIVAGILAVSVIGVGIYAISSGVLFR